ncbi:hypothetical protein YPPY66_3263, partial [Yersinia pestis PY-66]
MFNHRPLAIIGWG